ncbi:LLM class flavin-dependent oxidoreductase [Kaistia nematophila]|uniref:LLM class flavin-dependent oxidoreductase n=1 Tax=Kaistia nematophila TaxID=2994654 RepID=A0A9X3IM96_9HYPH|nr:LLM class flavin-dependent oxidoreductase [Kaistia nematophila]MCX5569660.1 LLM class flavin-dependent oxidoreductase [Kaistia nematophila]
MSARSIHLNVNVLSSGSHGASWRAADGNPLGYVQIEHYQEIARIAERGRLDAVFLADALAIAFDPRTNPSWALDPAVIVAGMAAVTSRIGFIASASTTYSHPYNIARTFASLDHASHGRVGWNVVTTYDERAAPNFGDKNLPVHADRYGRAVEFVDVVQSLWDSWEDDALVLDREAGRFADAAKIHAINHQGPHFSVAGPLQIPRSPQGRPLLVQAGSSEQGRDLAARYAEAIFSVQQDLGEAKAYYADVKGRAARYGRDPDKIAILPGLFVIVGSTEEEAHSRRKQLDEIAGEATVLRRFAGQLGLDPAQLDLDRPVPEHLLEKINGYMGTRGFVEATLSLARNRSLTVRDIIARGGGAHRLVVGGPEQIADTIQHWVQERAADGFNIMCDVFPSGLAAFVEHVVPELQKRGLFRREYEGTTLRDHYGLPRPPSRFAQQKAPSESEARQHWEVAL